MAAAATSSLHRQLAAAHTVRGAIAAAIPWRSDFEHFALTCFKNALGVPGHQASVVAKELEAHQLRKVGHHALAQKAYTQLQALALSVDSAREQSLIVARSKRYLAELHQARAIENFRQKRSPTEGSTIARDLMTSRVPNAMAPGALTVRDNFAPYQDWELLEGGDMNYFTAFVYSKLVNGNALEKSHLAQAEADYNGICNQLAQRRWFFGSSNRRLRRQAKLGLDRVAKARDSGDYDTAWLLPSLQ